MSIGIPHLTLVIELIPGAGVSTLNQKILQPKTPLNRRAIERITRADGGGDGGGARASGAGSSQQARLGKTRVTIADLARVVDEQQAKL